jgi:hypothetical protein
MGGANESIQKPDPVEKASSILAPDDPGVALKEQSAPIRAAGDDLPRQTQTIRQHVSAGSCHFHDDAHKLKVSIPVAEMHVLMRKLRNLERCSYIDTQFKSVIYFKPYVSDNHTFEVSIELRPITIGQRFENLSNLVGR